MSRTIGFFKMGWPNTYAQHGPAEVGAFLDAKGRDSSVEAWRLAQISDAIQILFCQVLRVSWCAEVDWRHWAEGGRQLSDQHATVARDYAAVPAGLGVDGGSVVQAMDEDGAPARDEAVLERLVVGI